VLFDEETPLRLIQKVRPDVLVKGEDYTKEEVVGAEEVENWGGTVELVTLVDGLSTSKIIDDIRRTSEAKQSNSSKGLT
jgi:D-beta-D-heptose 7-phosphate kinase/D-beta-D-heptose 1-phosphate adenosyltransferase